MVLALLALEDGTGKYLNFSHKSFWLTLVGFDPYLVQYSSMSATFIVEKLIILLL